MTFSHAPIDGASMPAIGTDHFHIINHDVLICRSPPSEADTRVIHERMNLLHSIRVESGPVAMEILREFDRRHLTVAGMSNHTSIGLRLVQNAVMRNTTLIELAKYPQHLLMTKREFERQLLAIDGSPHRIYVDVLEGRRVPSNADRLVLEARCRLISGIINEYGHAVTDQRLRQFDARHVVPMVGPNTAPTRPPMYPSQPGAWTRFLKLFRRDENSQAIQCIEVHQPRTNPRPLQTIIYPTNASTHEAGPDDPACASCMTNAVNCTIVPCGHTQYCSACATQWVKAHKICPSCRQNTTHVVRHY